MKIKRLSLILMSVLASIILVFTLSCDSGGGGDDGGGDVGDGDGGGDVGGDTSRPTVTITAPASGTVTQSTSVTVSGTAEDDTALAGVKFSLDETDWEDATLTGTDWTASVNLVEGPNTISVKAVDATGNESEIAAIVVTCDTIVPAAPTITGISDGIRSSDQTFSVSGESDATIEYSIDNAVTWNDYTGAVTLTVDATYYVTARQTDAAGHLSANAEVITVTIDKNIPANGLVGEWLFAGNADDSSGNANHGTVFEATLTKDRFGYENNAYDFDGINDYIEIVYSSVFDLDDHITVSAWVNHNTGNPAQYEDVVIKPYAYGFQYSQSTGTFMFHLRDGGWKNLDSDIKPNAGEWYHLVGTYDGSTQKIYVDGQLIATDDWALPLNTNDESLWVGYKVAGDNNWANSVIDDIRIFDRALELTEVQELYSVGGWSKE